MALNDSNQFRLRALALLQQQRDYIHQLEEALKQAQRWRFGTHSETLPVGTKRSQFEEDADTDIAVLETQLSRLHIKENAPPAQPKRQPLPATLPCEDIWLALEIEPYFYYQGTVDTFPVSVQKSIMFITLDVIPDGFHKSHKSRRSLSPVGIIKMKSLKIWAPVR